MNLLQQLQRITEITYKDYSRDDSKNLKDKLNDNIKEIYKSLRQSEQLIDHALKLKQETGSTQRHFYKDTFTKFSKIGERLVKLQSKVKEFSK
jgi:hypothetical protein